MESVSIQRKQSSQANAAAEKKLPEKKFVTTGSISATIWQNEAKLKSGQSYAYRTVSLQRSYKDKNNQWQTSNSLRVNDLPKAAMVLNKAYEYLILREQGHGSNADSEEAEENIEEEIVI